MKGKSIKSSLIFFLLLLKKIPISRYSPLTPRPIILPTPSTTFLTQNNTTQKQTPTQTQTQTPNPAPETSNVRIEISLGLLLTLTRI